MIRPEQYESREMKWGVCIDDNSGCFLIGTNVNIGDGHYYLCIYLGFKTLVIGYDYFK